MVIALGDSEAAPRNPTMGPKVRELSDTVGSKEESAIGRSIKTKLQDMVCS